jgi:cyclase
MKLKFLALLILFTVVSLSFAQSDLYAIKIKKVKDNVYFAYRPEPLRNFVEGNVTIIINDDDVVVVDAGGAPAAARNVIAEIKKLTPKPVRYVINTHIHKDHRFGNQEYVKQFPGVEIIAHPGVREVIARTSDQYMTSLLKRIEEPQRQVEDEIQRLRKEDKPGNQKVIAHLARFINQDIHAIRREYRTVINTPPTLTVDRKLILHRGRRTIEILFLGHGDTEHDLVVYLPDDKVICSGDMVVHPFPYGFSEQPLEWSKTLGKLAEFDFEYLIPGHGEVQHGKAYLRAIESLLQSVQAQVKDGIAVGADLETVRKKVNLSTFEKEFAGGDPVYRYFFKDYFSDPNIERTFKVLQQKPSN